MSKKLTIAIPTYNRAQSLKTTLERVFKGLELLSASNREMVEVLISNNGSTDNTKEICAEFPFIYMEHEKNLGYDANVLSLYTKSKGEYIFLLSDDDEFEYEHLEELMYVLSKYNASVIFVNWYSKNCDGIKISHLHPKILEMDGLFAFDRVCHLAPFYFLSSFILRKCSFDESVLIPHTYATQMQIALEILQKTSLCYTFRKFLVGRIEPVVELEGGCNVSANEWRIHLGFAKVKRLYQDKFNIQMSPLAEMRSCLSSFNFLLNQNKPIELRFKVFMQSIMEGLRNTKINRLLAKLKK